MFFTDHPASKDLKLTSINNQGRKTVPVIYYMVIRKA